MIIPFSSCLFSFEIEYSSILLIRNLMLALFCSIGWHESAGIIQYLLLLKIINKNWVDKVINTMQTSNNNTMCNTPENNKKYVAFTYVSKEIYHVTKLFKTLGVGTAFKTNNNIGKCLSKLHGSTTYSEYQNSGVYQLQCPDCSLVYTKQTGHRFKIKT